MSIINNQYSPYPVGYNPQLKSRAIRQEGSYSSFNAPPYQTAPFLTANGFVPVYATNPTTYNAYNPSQLPPSYEDLYSYGNSLQTPPPPYSSQEQTTYQVGESLKANVLARPSINSKSGYREVSTFNVPYLNNKGKAYKLDNGQTVIIIPKPGPTILRTFIKVGSFNEPDDQRGISHFIEHSVFNGSDKLQPGEFVDRVTERGAKYNAGTGFSSTNYFIESALLSPNEFDEFIEMQADMIKHPKFTPEMIEKEKGPVISEIKMYEDDPIDKAYNLSLKNLFSINNNYQGLIAGSESNISRLTVDDVNEYYKKWYTPDNMTTIIVGDVNPNQAIKTVSKHFREKQASSADNNKDKSDKYNQSLNTSIQSPVREDVKSPNTNSAIMNMTFIGPRNDDIKEAFAVNALMVALTGYDNSRLNKSLKPFNTNAMSALNVISSKEDDPQVIQVSSSFEPGEEEEGISTIYSAIQSLTENPPSEKELKIIKNKLKENLANDSEHSMDITERAGESIVDHGDLKAYTNMPEMIQSLTPQDIQNAAKKYLDLNKTSMVVVHPEAQQLKLSKEESQSNNSGNIKFGRAQIEESQIESMNKSYKYREKTSPDAISKILGSQNEFYLSNNIDFVLNNNPNTAKASALIQLKTNDMPKAKPGVAQVYSLIMSKGPKGATEEKFKEIIDENNLGIGFYPDNDSINVGAECQPENLPLALHVMKTSLCNPDFSQEKFKQSKEEVKSLFSRVNDDALSGALESLYPNSPYGYTPRKIAKEIDNVTLQDIINFDKEIKEKAQGKAVITAPMEQVNSEQGYYIPYTQESLIRSLSTLPMVQKPKYENTYSPEPVSRQSVVTKEEDRNQAHIVNMIRIQESGNIKDHAAIMVLNEILGGNSNSRLFQDLREKENLAYKVKSDYTSNGETGEITLEIKTTTRDTANPQNKKPNNNLQRSLDGFEKHKNMLIDEKVSEDDLLGAKHSAKTKLILGAESSAEKTESIMNGLNTQYGLTYTAELFKAIDNLTEDDIQHAAKAYLDSNKNPSSISINASKEALADSQKYLKDKEKS